MSRRGCVYIITNYNRTVLYIGVTNNIYARMQEHKNGIGGIFTSKYECRYLLYLEGFMDIADAIAREKQLKRWHREWKFNLIKEDNPNLEDLSESWFDKNDQLKDPALAYDHL